MSAAEARPFCSAGSRAAGEPVGATASRAEHWVLVEYDGHWPAQVLDAAPFAGRMGERLARRLDGLHEAKLLLVKPPEAERGDGVAVVLGITPERGGWFRRLRLDSHLDLLDLDLERAFAERPGLPLAHPLLLACTHGARDRCCALHGRAVCRALAAGPYARWLWQTSHVGGHRFAGNLVCLPEGLFFGRVGEAEAAGVVGAYVAGRIDLAHYRGRSAYSRAAQAAELHVRERTGLVGLHDLRLLAEEGDGRRTVVALLAELAGEVHRLEVESEPGPELLRSCKDERPKAPKRFLVRSHEVSAAV